MQQHRVRSGFPMAARKFWNSLPKDAWPTQGSRGVEVCDVLLIFSLKSPRRFEPEPEPNYFPKTNIVK